MDSGSRKHTAPRLNVQHLREALNLTPAEADPALHLLSGLSPRKRATHRGISEKTMPTQVRMAKAKFGASRTSERIAFLAVFSR